MVTKQIRYAIAALALGAVMATGHAQFTDIGAALTPVDSGSVAWGDYDNDGHLDILLTGWSDAGLVAEVYRNNGDGTFTDIGAGLTGVSQGSAAWADYNDNGRLDILLTGRTAGFQSVAIVYENNGDGTFTDIGAALTGVSQGAAAWADYNDNGLPDILLTGFDNSFNPVAKVYQNNGDGTFTDLDAGLTGVSSGSAAWGDYNGNELPDVLVMGWSGSEVVAKLYENHGDGTFTEVDAGLTGVDFGGVAWGDFDGSGRLDILLAGYDNAFNPVSVVYQNNGDGSFTEVNAGLAGAGDGSVAVADYNNDGHLDILLTGWNGSEASATVYENNGDGTFTDIGAGLTGVEFSSVAWGDYDNDGNPDILLTGWSSTGPVTKVYRNERDPVDEDPVDEEPEEPTVTERLESLLDDLHALQADRRINNGVANAATNQLGNVLRSHDRGNLNAACNQLQGFTNLIQGQVRSRRLDAGDGQALIDAANETRTALGCNE